jgi:DNA-binding CsgD family transcriptional regulator
MLQIPTPDDQRRARLALLTDKERECLVRWLTHATAKEIALELGVSHHAVEKRLKSARQKLGVTTTLDAARMLAASEDYGRTASQPPEMAAGDTAGQSDGTAAPAASPGGKRRGWIIAGAIIMSLVLLAVLSLAGQSQTSTVAGTPDRKVVVVDRKTGSPVDLTSVLSSAFDAMDKNNDNVVAGDELTNQQFRVMRQTIKAGEKAPSPAVTTIVNFDSDGDKRVSEAEFQAGMASLTRPR